jgi:hypothetical protein
MTNDRIIRQLTRMARHHSVAADRADEQWMAECILQHRKLIVAARKSLEKLTAENDELKGRLVRQACYLEVIEAKHEPRWPLLQPEQDPGMGL